MIILIIILVLLPVVLFVAFFTRQGINTAAVIEVSKPQQQVFDYLSMLKNQEQFNSWLMPDAQMQKTYSGTDGELSCKMAWESSNRKNGRGKQRIISLTSPDQIKIQITFEQPVRSYAVYRFELTSINNNNTRVNWIYEGNPAPHYFLRVLQLLLRLKKRVNQHMRISLQNIKNKLEHNL